MYTWVHLPRWSGARNTTFVSCQAKKITVTLELWGRRDWAVCGMLWCMVCSPFWDVAVKTGTVFRGERRVGPLIIEDQ